MKNTKNYITLDGTKVYEEYNSNYTLIHKVIIYSISKEEYKYDDNGKEIEYISYFSNGDIKYRRRINNNEIIEEFAKSNLKKVTLLLDDNRKIVKTFKRSDNTFLNIKEYEDDDNYVIDYLDGRIRKIYKEGNVYTSELYRDGILEETYTKEEKDKKHYTTNTIFHIRDHEISINKNGNKILIISPKVRVEILIGNRIVTKLMTITKDDDELFVIYKYKRYTSRMKLIEKIYSDPDTNKRVIEKFNYKGNKRIVVSSINY